MLRGNIYFFKKDVQMFQGKAAVLNYKPITRRKETKSESGSMLYCIECDMTPPHSKIQEIGNSSTGRKCLPIKI